MLASSIKRILALVAVALSLLLAVDGHRRTGAEAIIHPLLMSNALGTCFNADVPFGDICYPTRCYHLFEITSAGQLTPTPLAKNQNPQQYSKFECIVQTRAVYNGVPTSTTPAASCQYPVCRCRGSSTATCEPGKLGDCWSHVCP